MQDSPSGRDTCPREEQIPLLHAAQGLDALGPFAELLRGVESHGPRGPFHLGDRGVLPGAIQRDEVQFRTGVPVFADGLEIEPQPLLERISPQQAAEESLASLGHVAWKVGLDVAIPHLVHAVQLEGGQVRPDVSQPEVRERILDRVESVARLGGRCFRDRNVPANEPQFLERGQVLSQVGLVEPGLAGDLAEFPAAGGDRGEDGEVGSRLADLLVLMVRSVRYLSYHKTSIVGSPSRRRSPGNIESSRIGAGPEAGASADFGLRCSRRAKEAPQPCRRPWQGRRGVIPKGLRVNWGGSRWGSTSSGRSFKGTRQPLREDRARGLLAYRRWS